MQLLDDLEERYQINARRLNHGNHKIKCPACQPPHNSKDRPLSIEITNQKIMFFATTAIIKVASCLTIIEMLSPLLKKQKPTMNCIFILLNFIIWH